jgi:hypothetical protein
MVGKWFLVAALLCSSGFAQSVKSAAAGELTVTATVTGSVALLIGSNGEQTVVVANAPADRAALLSMPDFSTFPLQGTGGKVGKVFHKHAVTSSKEPSCLKLK